MYLYVNKYESQSDEFLFIQLARNSILISKQALTCNSWEEALFSFYFWADYLPINEVLKNHLCHIDLNKKTKIHLSGESKKKIRNIFTRIENRMINGVTFISLESMVYLSYLINWAYLIDFIKEKTFGVKSEKLLQLLCAMEKNHNQNRMIKYYSRLIPISPNYLSELCRTELKMGFRSLSNLLLIIRILDLLYEKRMTLGEIAHELHFTDQAHFCRYFKSEMSITPSEFRKKLLT